VAVVVGGEDRGAAPRKSLAVPDVETQHDEDEGPDDELEEDELEEC
jgi:hypothetical protein